LSSVTTPQSTAPIGDSFATTHWTRVLEACGNSPAAKEALSELCANYYAPVFAFIRRDARDDDAARDLTQEFFSRLLGHSNIDGVDPERGRFRSFLLGAVKHFLADARDREARLKRGGASVIEPLQPETDTTPGLQLADPNIPGPDQLFDRKWALALLDRALAELAAEHKDCGKLEQFDLLKIWLTGNNESADRHEIARELGMNEATLKVVIHRLRRRFREVIKNELRRTLHDPALVNDELQHLLQALL